MGWKGLFYPILQKLPTLVKKSLLKRSLGVIWKNKNRLNSQSNRTLIRKRNESDLAKDTISSMN